MSISAHIVAPLQSRALGPVDGQDGRWAGELRFEVSRQGIPGHGTSIYMRVEAYALDSSDETVVDLVVEFENLAYSGSPLQTVKIDGRDCYLVIMPKGR